MGETPIILLPVVAPEPHIKSRTPSDSAIVAIFQDKRKPQSATRRAFPLDFTRICALYGGFLRVTQELYPRFTGADSRPDSYSQAYSRRAI
jgi:hypothetical protein